MGLKNPWLKGRVGSTPTPGSSLMAQRILLIDDSEDFRSALAIRMRSEGFEVSTAGSGQEGLEAIAAKPFDLVLEVLGRASGAI